MIYFSCWCWCYRCLSCSPLIERLDARIAAAKDGALLAKRNRKVDSHLAVVAAAVILAHEDVEERQQTFLQMLGKGETKLLYVCCQCVS